MRKFKFNLLTLRVLVSILLTKRSFLAGGGYWPCSSSKPILWLWPWKPFCDYDHENQWHFNKSWDMGSTHWVRFNLSKLLQCFVSCFSLGTLYWSIEVLDTLFQWSMIMFKICFFDHFIGLLSREYYCPAAGGIIEQSTWYLECWLGQGDAPDQTIVFGIFKRWIPFVNVGWLRCDAPDQTVVFGIPLENRTVPIDDGLADVDDCVGGGVILI